MVDRTVAETIELEDDEEEEVGGAVCEEVDG